MLSLIWMKDVDRVYLNRYNFDETKSKTHTLTPDKIFTESENIVYMQMNVKTGLIDILCEYETEGIHYMSRAKIIIEGDYVYLNNVMKYNDDEYVLFNNQAHRDIFKFVIENGLDMLNNSELEKAIKCLYVEDVKEEDSNNDIDIDSLVVIYNQDYPVMSVKYKLKNKNGKIINDIIKLKRTSNLGDFSLFISKNIQSITNQKQLYEVFGTTCLSKLTIQEVYEGICNRLGVEDDEMVDIPSSVDIC